MAVIAQRKPSKKAPARRAGQRESRLRRWTARAVRVGAWGMLVFFLATVGGVAALRFLDPPISGLMLFRHFGQGQPVDRTWCDYEDISPHLLLAILAAEDQRFYAHHGFDWKEIRVALEEHRAGGPMRGASTLSQQTAKNVFLWPSRSWLRKGGEAYFTVLIELLWPKRRILEVYANVAEMGPGVYGVERGAQRYFATSAADLAPREAALLATILPSPLTRDPRAPTAEMKERQAWILTQMDRMGGVRFLR